MITPRSPACFGSRIASLLVPTSTTPLPTVGLPYDCEPSSATHFTFLPVLMSHDVGNPFMSDTMLRLGVPPHIGQSLPPCAETATAAVATIVNAPATNVCRIFILCRLLVRRSLGEGGLARSPVARWPVGPIA